LVDLRLIAAIDDHLASSLRQGEGAGPAKPSARRADNGLAARNAEIHGKLSPVLARQPPRVRRSCQSDRGYRTSFWATRRDTLMAVAIAVGSGDSSTPGVRQYLRDPPCPGSCLGATLA